MVYAEDDEALLEAEVSACPFQFNLVLFFSRIFLLGKVKNCIILQSKRTARCWCPSLQTSEDNSCGEDDGLTVEPFLEH
jgi:hypothetical protein